jgi:RNA polymerase sigma-70 factor (ECF subfamily)
MDDAELVRQVLQGNIGAYGELVNRYVAQIAALCRAHVFRPDVVDDLAQETFLRGLDRLADLREHERFGFWLYGIARNLCLDWLNDPQNRCRSLDAAAQVAALNPVADDDRSSRIEQVRNCIRRLSVELREIIELYYGSGRATYQELADRLGVSFGQVNKLLTRARKLLRICLERADGDGLLAG